MAEIDPIILQLRADVDGYNAKVIAVAKSVENNLKKQERAVDQLEKKFKSSSSAIALSASSIGATLAGAFSVAKAKEFIDAYTRIQNQLRLTGLEGESLAATQDRLRQSANRYGVDLETLSQVYGRASQASSELGITQEQLLTFTNRVGAASKVAGTGIEAQKGALLQLAQALQSGTVRAEEYNSINEGLFPVLQAVAAGSDRFGGSIAKLRAAVIDGTVSSREFFNAFIAGSDTLENKAAAATLTLSGALTVLNNELTQYVGEASASNGVTAALSAGIQALAHNLDTIIPALAVIATLIGGRYVAGLVAATAAKISMSAATGLAAAQERAFTVALAQNAGMLNAQAVAARAAATATVGVGGAATLAGRSLLAAFGGPVGVAVIALTVGIGYLATRESDAERAARALASGHEAASKATEKLDGATQNLANAHGSARKEALALARAEAENVKQKLHSAQASLVLAQAEAARASALARNVASQAVTDAGLADMSLRGGAIATSDIAGTDATVSILRDREAAAKANEKQLEGQVIGLRKSLMAYEKAATGVANVSSGDTGGKGKPSKGKPSKAKTGPSPEDIARKAAQSEAQYQSELEGLNAQRITALSAMTGLANYEYAARIAQIDADQNSYARQVALDEDLSAEKRAALVAAKALVSEQERQVALQDYRAKNEADAYAIADAEIDLEIDAQRRALDFATLDKDRFKILEAIADLEKEKAASALEGIINSTKTTEAEKEIARLKLAELDAIRKDQGDRNAKDTEGPLASYKRDIESVDLNDEFENIAVNGLQKMNDGLTDAIMGAENLGDVFKNVAKQIIADLIRIAIQQIIVKTLMEAIGGGGGGGGGLASIGATLGSVFGRAGGGRVEVGRLYRVNETQQEFLQPLQSGTVKTPQQAAAMSGRQSGQTAVVQLHVTRGEMFDATVQQISGDVSVRVVREAAPGIASAAVSETFRLGQRQTIR